MEKVGVVSGSTANGNLNMYEGSCLPFRARRPSLHKALSKLDCIGSSK